MALQFRKGLNSERLAITPATGEPIWTTDTEKLYIGDGSTIGGVELSVDSAFISGIINTTDFNSLIDSAYVQARQLAQTPQDFEYGSLVNTPNILDSANVSSIVVGYSYVTQTAIDNSIDALINGAPGALDTLKELADALGEDSDAIAAINTTLGLKINATAFDGLFASALSTKTTTDVAEGNNLYYTSARHDSDTIAQVDASFVQALQIQQDFSYASLTGAPNVLDSADVVSVTTDTVDATFVRNLQDYSYSNLTGRPNILDSGHVTSIIDSEAVLLINSTVDATFVRNLQDYSYANITGAPTNVSSFANDAGYITAAGATDSAEVTGIINNVVDAAFVQALSPLQDFAYGSLTGAPNVLDSADVVAIHNALGGVDSAAITSMIDSNYVASRVTLAYAGNATVKNYKFIADSGDTIFAGADANGLSLSFNDQLVQVYLNGVLLLDTEDYTKSGNNTITLVDPADAGDQLIVANFKSFFSSAGLDSAGITAVVDASYIQANQTPQDFAYTSLTGTPNITSIVDSAINALVDGAPAALDTLAELATQLNNDSDAIAAVVNTLGLKLNITDVVPQDFAYGSLTGVPNVLDSANVIALQTPQDFAYASLTGAPTNISTFANDAGYITAAAATDSAEVTGIINNVVDSAYVQALSPLQDFAYASLTGTPNILDSADVIALSPPQDFAYASLTGTPNILDSADVVAIHNALGGVDSAAITNMVDSNYVASRVTLAYAGNATVKNYKFIADSGDTVFTGSDANGLSLSFTDQLVQVYLNGVLLLETEDYTKSGHDTITLVDPADTGDQLIIADFKSFFASAGLDSAGVTSIVDSAYVQALSTLQDFAYASLTGTPNILDSSDVISLSPPQDFAYASLTGTPNIIGIVDSAINALVDGAPAALDTLNELATALNDDSNAIAAITSTLALKLNIADVVAQDFAYASLTGTPSLFDGNYSSLAGTPNILDSANIVAIHNALGGVDSAAITSMIDSNYVASRVTLAFAGSATVHNYKFIADSGDTIFTGADANSTTLGFTDQLVQVYLNGVLLLESEDYTKSGQDTITLVDPADAGDQLIIADFTAFFAGAGLSAEDVTTAVDSAYVQSRQTPQDFAYASLTGAPTLFDGAYSSLTGAPNILDSANVIALQTPQTPQDFAYASLTGTPNILDSANVSILITTAVDSLVAGAPAALDTLNELATQLENDSNAIAAITNTLALKLNIADVVAQDFAYGSLTGTPNILDSADVISLSPPQDFAYASLTGTPNILDSAAVTAIASALGGVDSAAITSMIDSDYITSRASLAYAGNASVSDTKFIADSDQTIFTGLSFNNQFVQVHLNGVLLVDSDDYVKSGNDTITITTPLNLGDQLVVSDFTAFFTNTTVTAATINGLIDSALSNANVGIASITDTKFIADSAQTIFTGLSFNDQLIQVHLNGVLLIDSDDYVKSGNDTITTTYGLNIGDQLVVSDFTAFFSNTPVAVIPQDFAYASLTGAPNILDSADVIALSPPQDFAYASLTGTPNILDSADVIALSPPQDFAYASLTGSPNITSIVDSAINALVDGAPGALDTLAELATQLNNDSNAIAAIVTNLALKLNIADVVPQDFAYASLTGAPTLFDGNYSSLAGIPNVLDSADVVAIASALGGVDSSAITSMIDSNYVASRVTLAYAGNASVENIKFVADSGQTIFNGLSYSDQLVQVYLNGVLLLDSDDYVKSGNDTITLTQAATIGDQLVVSDFTAFFTNQTVDSAYITGLMANTASSSLTSYAFVADSGATTFGGMVYSPNNIQVFLNGILLGDSDYTATNGTTIVLESAVTQDDEIRVTSFNGLYTVDIAGFVDSAYINARVDALPQDFAYASLTGAPTLFDGNYASLANLPNILDSANVSTLITTAVDALVGGAPAALDTLNELATQLNNDSDAIAAITNTLALKLNIADVVAQDFAYASLTGTPNILDSADVIALSPPQDFAYASLTGTPSLFDGNYSSLAGTPNILDSADVISIASAIGGVDSAAIIGIIDSDYVASRVTLAYAGNASVQNTKFVADSAQTVFNGLSYNDQLVQVYLNGVLLLDSDDYVKSGNDTITLTQAAATGDQLIVSDFSAFFSYTSIDSATVTAIAGAATSPYNSTEFTSSAGQDTFSVNYTIGRIAVYINGVKLSSADYTATNGTSVVLDIALTAGNTVEIVDHGVAYATNAVTTGKAIAMALVFGG